MRKPLPTKRVIAGVFGPVAMEDNPRRFIDAEPVEIPLSSYYLRRLADGELIDAPEARKEKK